MFAKLFCTQRLQCAVCHFWLVCGLDLLALIDCKECQLKHANDYTACSLLSNYRNFAEFFVCFVSFIDRM